MSDQPQPQPPSSPKPKAGQSKTTRAQASQKPLSRPQPFLKAQTIKVLRTTIGVLEGAVVKLEAEPSASTVQPSLLNKLQLGWNAALAKIRSLLPENLKQVSNPALTGIIAGFALILVWITSALLSGTPPEVANVPPQTPPEVAEAPQQTPPEVANVPAQTPPEVVEAPQQTPPEVVPPAESVPSPELTNPPELTQKEPQPIEVTPPPESVPTPPPVELTPEQILIASIQNEVAEVTNQYADGLIQSIQANFQGSRLTIKVSDAWYNLNSPQQDKLAGEMLQRATELDFSQLDITDLQGTLLARSPVVGSNMIILKRQLPSERILGSGE